MNPLLARARSWLFEFEGSTRPLGLIRAGTALLVFAEFAHELAFFNDARGGKIVVATSLYLSSLALFAGWKSRAAALWSGLTQIAVWFYAGRVLGGFVYAHHHNWLLMSLTLLLALTPCGGSFSLDRWRAVRAAAKTGAPPPAEHGELWAQRLLAIQISAVYFWSACDKLTWPFLSGARLEHYYMYYYAGSESFGDFNAQPLLAALSIGVVLLELLLSFGLFVPRWQRWLIPAGIAFHCVFYVFLPVWIFTCLMSLYYLAFLPPERVHRFFDEMLGADPRLAAGPPLG